MSFRITTIHAFICVGPDDEEGIPVVMGPNGMLLPLVAADEKRLLFFEEIVKKRVRNNDLPNCKLVRFSVRDDIKEY